MWRSIVFIPAAMILFSCTGNVDPSFTAREKEQLLALGDSITIEAQNILLQNVSSAIQKGGTSYAVDFCNIRAMPLTDAVAGSHQVTIRRVTDKSRNPANALQTATDSLVWEQLKAEQEHRIVREKDGGIYYYKPIILAMPACMKCHGGKDDIQESTLKIITRKYPGDQATGYKPGDIRGMWKVKIKE